ncbi:MAG: DUF4845 domain-containing protein [Betaproteobacteria bacterium]|jgi:Domain of unknown function (DUF4845)|nr:DUF4845 domain-containing protein [Betaproteobacteria bacterium]
MKKQNGVSLSGFLMVLVALAFVALLGFKIFGPYKQFFTIQKTFKTLAANPEVKNGGKREFVLAWSKYAMTDGDINVLSGEDIDVAKEGNEIVISANYTVKVPLFKNISLMFDFAPTSAAK